MRWGGGAKQLTNSRPIYANAEEYMDAGHKRKPTKRREREKKQNQTYTHT